jgi:hypothetical protein
MSIEKRLLGVNPVASGDGAEGVSFDGENDYLSRSSDLVGNTASKTFTFSAWFYLSGVSGQCYLFHNITSFDDGGIYIKVEHKTWSGADTLGISGLGIPASGWGGGTTYLNFESSISSYSINTWHHLLISIDLSDTSKRYVYLNDELLPITWNGYSNTAIGFSQTSIGVGATRTGSSKNKSRLAHIFLDHTYRDLSTESNRRLFIDSDGKPADGQADLNPILYLPMTDADTAGDNAGTGGDFTVNGVLATAERGPNQDNCSASEFDGSAYLYNTSPSNTPSSCQTITISYMLTGRTSGFMYDFNNGSNWMLYAEHPWQLRGQRTNGGWLWNVSASGYLSADKSYHLTYSFDLSDSSKRHIIVNGVDVTDDVTWNNYDDDNIPFSSCSNLRIGNRRSGTGALNDGAGLGEFYMDAEYYDLASDNPFWDSDANRPKPVAQVIDETGTTPWMALPLRADDAGKNLGDGGDFTVSGTLTGARGGSEFWARSAGESGTSSTDRLKRENAALVGASNGKQFTFVCAYKPDSIGSGGSKYILKISDGVTIDMYNYNQWSVSGYDASGTRDLFCYANNNTNVRAGEWTYILASFDMSDTSKRHFYYWDNSENDWVENLGVSTYTNDNLDFTNPHIYIGSGGMTLGHYWFNTEYVDFSQETNRNLFFDQLKFPKDLASDGSGPTGNQPLIYLKFDDLDDLGANSGTGGDFTVQGTVESGADVNS